MLEGPLCPTLFVLLRFVDLVPLRPNLYSRYFVPGGKGRTEYGDREHVSWLELERGWGDCNEQGVGSNVWRQRLSMLDETDLDQSEFSKIARLSKPKTSITPGVSEKPSSRSTRTAVELVVKSSLFYYFHCLFFPPPTKSAREPKSHPIT